MKHVLREENQQILNQAMELARESKTGGHAIEYVREAAQRLGVEDLDQRRAHMLSELVSERLRGH